MSNLARVSPSDLARRYAKFGVRFGKRIVLNLLTGWKCIGFCDSPPNSPDHDIWVGHCERFCGEGRWVKCLSVKPQAPALPPGE